MQQYPHQYHQQEQRKLDAFLAHVMKRLAVSRKAQHITTQYFNAHTVEQTPGGKARAIILPYSDYLCALAAGHGATTRTEYLRSVEMTAADFEAIAAETPRQRARRYERNARWQNAEAYNSIFTDDADVWPALAAAWRPMANVWRRVLRDLMPDLDDVFAYLFVLEPAAFWGAYWDWMLHDQKDGRNNYDVDTYIAELPQTVLEPHRTLESDAACEQALEKELSMMDEAHWIRLQSDRATRALIATRTLIAPPADFFAHHRAN